MSTSSASQVPSNLPELVSQQWDSALKNKSAFFYPSEIHRITDDAQAAEDDKENGIAYPEMKWSVRRCEALRLKAKEKQEAKQQDDSSKDQSTQGQNPTDVFAPPYDPHLLIKDLGSHTLLLNKFALIPHHALLVTKDFRPQSLPPSPETLATSYQVLNSLPSKNPDDLLCFFNCGPESGASQPHCHMQFVNLSEGGGVLIESLLDRIEKDGKEMDTIHALPLPYQHFVHLLPPSMSPSSLDQVLGATLMKLLDAMFQARSAAMINDDPSGSGRRPSHTSWNLLLTRRAMHLIPREKEEFRLDQHGGEQKSQEIGALSLNALCFAGHLVTKSNEEVEEIRKFPGGVRGILKHVGRKPVSDFTVASTGTEGQ
ncbi:unnamed protein product [Sympodiomycopsis kandeliae]